MMTMFGGPGRAAAGVSGVEEVQLNKAGKKRKKIKIRMVENVGSKASVLGATMIGKADNIRHTAS